MCPDEITAENGIEIESEAAGQPEEEVNNGVHNYSREDEWIRPDDPLILERLEWFQDQKLGLMMHWGPYSQIGVVESWALSDDDAYWSRGGIDWTEDGQEFQREYFDLNKTFNPIRFQPELWADMAAEGGFKYLIFTTKHHDGFCMWDTHQTEYKITGKDCPFHTHQYADVCKNLFDAFRSRGLAIAAYFSKADWNTPYYWAPGMERGRNMWRGPSYDPKKYPWLWNQFVQFTHDQILELMTRYGRIDILWLDAGWVAAKNQQDIQIEKIVEDARKYQPWLLAADRTVGGVCENYITPEQMIPEQPIRVPWESNITIGGSFSFCYDDHYKSARTLAHMLIDVISKGGNLALNIGPQPDGRIPMGAIQSIRELGQWLKVYGEAVYGTRICAPYRKDRFAFTCKKEIKYAFCLYDDENSPVEEKLFIPYTEKRISRIDLVGGRESLEFHQEPRGISVTLPVSEAAAPAPIAHVFRMFSE